MVKGLPGSEPGQEAGWGCFPEAPGAPLGGALPAACLRAPLGDGGGAGGSQPARSYPDTQQLMTRPALGAAPGPSDGFSARSSFGPPLCWDSCRGNTGDGVVCRELPRGARAFPGVLL